MAKAERESAVQVTAIDPAVQADLAVDHENGIWMFRGEPKAPFCVREDGSLVKMNREFYALPAFPTVHAVDLLIEDIKAIGGEVKGITKRIHERDGWVVVVRGNDGEVEIQAGRTIVDLWREQYGLGGVGAVDRLKGRLREAGAL